MSGGFLALIEQQSRLEYELCEVAGFRDGSRYPLMDPERRQEEIAKLNESIEQLCREIERLTALVGATPSNRLGRIGSR